MKSYSDTASLFRALADPTRCAVTLRLAEGPLAVKALAEPFEMALPSFLKHLRVLEEGGVIRTEKRGRVRMCHLETARLRGAEDWLAGLRHGWEGRLDRLDAMLREQEGRRDGP